MMKLQMSDIRYCIHSVMDHPHTWKTKSLMHLTSSIMTQILKSEDRLTKYSQDTGALENGMLCELETILFRNITSWRNAHWIIALTLYLSSLMLDAKLWRWIDVRNNSSLDPSFKRTAIAVPSPSLPPLLLDLRIRCYIGIKRILSQHSFAKMATIKMGTSPSGQAVLSVLRKTG